MKSAENATSFGTCPFCGEDLIWDSDEEWYGDDRCIQRACSCPNCGSCIEATQPVPEERSNYPFWGD